MKDVEWAWSVRLPYPIRRFATLTNGDIVSIHRSLEDYRVHERSALSISMIEAKVDELRAEPWQRAVIEVPGYSLKQTEMVLNDALFLDWIHGAGTYARCAETYEENAELYGALMRAGSFEKN